MKRFTLRFIFKIFFAFIFVVLSILCSPKLFAKPAGETGEVTISDFEKGQEEWQGSGSLETDNVRKGNNSLKLTSDGFNWEAYGATGGDLDLSILNESAYEMAIFVYVDDPLNISGIRLDLGSDSANFYYASQQTNKFYQQGWNEVRFKINDFSKQYSPAGWSQIKYIRVNLAAQKNSSVSAWIDDWKITSAPQEIISSISPQEIISPEVKGDTATNTAVSPQVTSNTANQKNKNINQGGDILKIIIIGILIAALIGLVSWMVIQFNKKRKTNLREQPPPENRGRKFSFDFLRQNMDTRIALVICGGLLFWTTGLLSWYWLGNLKISPPKNNVTPIVLPASTARPQSETQTQPQQNLSSATKWQYNIVTFVIPDESEDIEDALNEMGAEGWEVVSQSVSSTGVSGEYNQIYTLKKILTKEEAE